MHALAVLTSPDLVATPLPAPAPGVVFQLVPGGAVLLSTADEVYFGLNTVGALIWQSLPPADGAAATVEETCDRIRARYPEAEPGRVRADVVTLLAALREARLVRDEISAA